MARKTDPALRSGRNYGVPQKLSGYGLRTLDKVRFCVD